MSGVEDPKKDKYFEMLLKREEEGYQFPKYAKEIMDRNKSIKFRHCVSKVIVSGGSKANIVQDILGWLKDVKPEVVIKT